MSNITPKEIILTFYSPQKMEKWAEKLGKNLRGGEIFLFYGTLGTGKTLIIRGLARGIGIIEPITSPTFTLIHEYRTSHITFYHLDLYRIQRIEEIWDLGLEELFRQPQTVLAIEWAEKVPIQFIPNVPISIFLSYLPKGRKVKIANLPIYLQTSIDKKQNINY